MRQPHVIDRLPTEYERWEAEQEDRVTLIRILEGIALAGIAFLIITAVILFAPS